MTVLLGRVPRLVVRIAMRALEMFSSQSMIFYADGCIAI